MTNHVAQRHVLVHVFVCNDLHLLTITTKAAYINLVGHRSINFGGYKGSDFLNLQAEEQLIRTLQCLHFNHSSPKPRKLQGHDEKLKCRAVWWGVVLGNPVPAQLKKPDTPDWDTGMTYPKPVILGA